MNRTLLNADVLLLVFSLANEQTQLALLSTCKWLYREGGKQFLKSTTVCIESEGDLSSFLRFMDADGGSRMRFLRRLYIAELDEDSEYLPSEPIVRQFTKMIKCLIPVSQLTYLGICDLEELLLAHPPLWKAIAQLTSLKEVHFTEIGEISLEMLISMRSKVENADIDLGSLYYGVSRSREHEHAIMFLRQLSSSLRVLRVVGGWDSVEPQDGDPQYPLVSELAVDNPTSFVTWHYVRAFPNLKKLTVTEISDLVGEAEAVGLSEFRARNLAQLRRHGCWESLDVFHGPTRMLWLLGLPCPISQLELVDHFDTDALITTDMIRDGLGPARTTRLDICICQVSLFLDEEFTRAFAGGCGATVKVLSLTLMINSDKHTHTAEDGDELDLGDVLGSVTDTLRACSVLESVTLCLDFRDDRESPAVVYAQEMDFDTACAALQQAIPSAKHVRLRLWNHRTRRSVEVEIGSEGSDRK